MSLENASRKNIVEGIRRSVQKRGSFGFPPKEAFNGKDEPEQVWAVWLDVQEGMLPETSLMNYFNSEGDADKYVSEHPIGSEFPFKPTWSNVPFDDWAEFGFFPIRRGDQDLYLPWQVLKDAGLSDGNGLHPSKKVLDFLGRERIGALQSKYGENWEAVAEFEYAFKQLPHSSPAFLAAACRFFYFVLEDDFSAGYLLRDLEVLFYGVEAQATKAIETRTRAGVAGSKQSAQAREKRRARLFEKMEALASRSPDIVKFGADAVAKIALQDCIKENAAMWRQGAGQVSEYLNEIRRGEAGAEMQKRYQDVFGSKPPKRFKGLG